LQKRKAEKDLASVLDEEALVGRGTKKAGRSAAATAKAGSQGKGAAAARAGASSKKPSGGPGKAATGKTVSLTAMATTVGRGARTKRKNRKYGSEEEGASLVTAEQEDDLLGFDQLDQDEGTAAAVGGEDLLGSDLDEEAEGLEMGDQEDDLLGSAEDDSGASEDGDEYEASESGDD
jgi:hypothetical protein